MMDTHRTLLAVIEGWVPTFLPARLELDDEQPETPSGKFREADLRGRYADA